MSMTELEADGPADQVDDVEQDPDQPAAAELTEPVLADADPPPADLSALGRVQASWPGWTQLHAALGVVDERMMRLPLWDGPQEHAGAISAYAETLADSAARHGALPGNIGDQVVAVARRAELVTAERTALHQTRQVLQRRLEEVERANTDAGLRMLDDELQQLMAELRATVDTLADVRTAEQALRGSHDQHAAFLRLDALRLAYGDLRGAQVTLTGDGASAYALIEQAGELRNVDEVWPEWWRAEGIPGVASAARPPWPSYVDRWPHPPIITTEHVVWLATSPAQPWVPTRDQLRAEAARLAGAADTRRHTALTGRPGQPVTDPGRPDPYGGPEIDRRGHQPGSFSWRA